MGIFPKDRGENQKYFETTTQLFSGIKFRAYSVIGHFQHNLAHADESCLCESFLAGHHTREVPPLTYPPPRNKGNQWVFISRYVRDSKHIFPRKTAPFLPCAGTSPNSASWGRNSSPNRNASSSFWETFLLQNSRHRGFEDYFTSSVVKAHGSQRRL